MALHSQLPLYKTVHELTQLVISTVRNMPRDYKKTLGERIVDELIAISVLVLRANIARDKRPHLDDLLERKEVANLLRQATHSHHDRARLANVLRDRGQSIDKNFTKTFRRSQR